MRESSTRLAFGSVLTLALALAACGGKRDGGSPTVPPVAASPMPAAPAVEPPLSASCERLPLGSADYKCRDEAANFHAEVVDAIATLQAEHPEYFKGNIVVNEAAYYVGLIRLLDRKNLCATFDGEELAVKSTNEYSDQYKVLTSCGRDQAHLHGNLLPGGVPARAPRAAAPSRRLLAGAEHRGRLRPHRFTFRR